MLFAPCCPPADGGHGFLPTWGEVEWGSLRSLAVSPNQGSRRSAALPKRVRCAFQLYKGEPTAVTPLVVGEGTGER